MLDIDESRRLVPGQNPTTVQVASSVLGTLFWMIRNPEKGVKLPDDLPHEEVLDIAMPYLGPFISQPVDWSPRLNGLHDSAKKNGKTNKFRDNNDEHEDWQFEQFLIAT